jgi:pimeloyl-ACP methyl ester carboxylesterase
VTAVLLHAFPLDERMWGPQLPALAEQDVVTPNLYDLGGSSMDGWAERILDEIEAGLALVGASMGGYAALAIARQAPERVRAILLAGARPDPDSDERRAGRAGTIELIENEGPPGLWENQRDKLFMDDAPPDAVDLAREMTLARETPELVRAIEAIRDRPDSTAVLDSIPVLFANGSGDIFFPPAEAEAFADRAENGRLVVFQRSRHLPNLEQPEDFNRMLSEFLQSGD